MSPKQKRIVMNSIIFTKGGYHYFLVPKEDGYYWLYSDVDFALQYLRTNELIKGVITSITKGEEIILTLGQRFQGNVVSEIKRINKHGTSFKVKLKPI